MKRFLSFCLILVVGVALGRLFDAAPQKAQAGGGNPLPPCQDINGDGQTNITDAVFLLNWLFRGGPEPTCQVNQALPDTGQTNCYNSGDSAIDCSSGDFPGQDGAYATGCPSEGRFVDNGDGTVSDICTGLMWQKETAPGGYWQDALKYCDDLKLAEHSDWRLPNVRELQSLVHYGRVNPSIDPVFGAQPSSYWSSSTDLSEPCFDDAWVVDFYTGHVDVGDKDNEPTRAVRAVRTGP